MKNGGQQKCLDKAMHWERGWVGMHHCLDSPPPPPPPPPKKKNKPPSQLQSSHHKADARMGTDAQIKFLYYPLQVMLPYRKIS